MVAALTAAQLPVAVPPARAAELPREDFATQQHGTFAGARVRLPFGGRENGKIRAGLSVTSMQRTDFADGASRTRFGEGVELGLSEGEAPALRIGGSPLSPVKAVADENEEKRSSTGDKVLTGAAIVLAVGAVAVGALLVAVFVQ